MAAGHTAHNHGYRDADVREVARAGVSEDETMARINQVTIGEIEYHAVDLA